MKSKSLTSQPSVQNLIDTLNGNRINTLTELCRVERLAASACTTPAQTIALRAPMTSAWHHYVVTSNHLLAELRGLTSSYPFSGDVVQESLRRVREDPKSNRSWNLAWLCLVKVLEDGLIPLYAATEAMKPEMWAGTEPKQEDLARLVGFFEFEWTAAVHRMLRHWTMSPTWY
jgi:hypothetical protein